MITLREPDPELLARAWLDVDPDPETRAETERLIAAGGVALSRRFATSLTFGTAGLRGPLGTGPTRMNRVLVRLVAAAIAEQVRHEASPLVVVGYDARHGSVDFARDTARVLAARGVGCTLLPEALPTPVLAFAVRHVGADAGIMVTASHNPRRDNGYKVYWRGGAMITAPIDALIAEAFETMALLSDEDLVPIDHPAISFADDSLIEAYLETILGSLAPTGSRAARVAYTPLHGVGAKTLLRAFQIAGFPVPEVVESQAAPDPDFPTTAFPNPEEPGVLDHLLTLASEVGADVAVANDPDGDRLAVAVPNGSTWRLLTGDDVGCLLAEHLLSRSTDDLRTPLVINTITSSRLLARIADHHRAIHAETLTGFKWIMHERAARPELRFVFGYEEALGYAVTDDILDKDGISAALVIAELVGDLRRAGRSVLDLLDDLHRRHGVHRTGQRSVRFEDASGIPPVMLTAMEGLRRRPPADLAGEPVQHLDDLTEGSTGLPPTDGVVLGLNRARVVIRPSGTEPKLKVYGETIVADPDLPTARATADTMLRAVIDAAVAYVTDAERLSSPADAGDTGATGERAAELFSTPSAAETQVDDLRLVVRCIDLTTLEGNDTPARIRALCSQARRPDPADPTVGPTAAVCVYPELVPLARELVGSSGVRVASVAGAFPSGLSGIDVRCADVADAVARGADEIDAVLNRSAFLSGRQDLARRELHAIREAAGATLLKVIIEVGELGSLDAIRTATRLAIDVGADFVKTSTGKTPKNASPEAVLVMAEELRDHTSRTGQQVGIKIAGGVRGSGEALGYVAIVRHVLGEAWLDRRLLRFGASSLLDALLKDLTATESTARTS